MLSVSVLFLAVSHGVTEYIRLEERLSGVTVGVEPLCSKNRLYPSNITVRTDAEIRVQVRCNNQFTLTVPQDSDLVSYKAKVYYSGNTKGTCVFRTILGSERYQVALEIDYLFNGAVLYRDTFTITCSYGDYSVSSRTVTRKYIDDSVQVPFQNYKHVHRVYSTFNSTSYFNITVLDVEGRDVTNTIPLGKQIRLHVTMTAGLTSEKGFRVFNCEGLPDGHSTDIRPYQFIRDGCGDGYIVSKTDGFTTTNLTADSPYFQAFLLYGSPNLQFMCHFYICHEECNGVSCIHHESNYDLVKDTQNVDNNAVRQGRSTMQRIKRTALAHSSTLIQPDMEAKGNIIRERSTG